MITGIILACSVQMECQALTSKDFFATMEDCQERLKDGYVEILNIGLIPVSGHCHNWGELV